MKAVFIDRDGVVNKYPGDKLYVTSLKKFKILPGVKKGIALLSKAGFDIFIASNQAGVGKGLYSLKTLNSITAKMLSDISKRGGKITKVYYCIHRKDERCSCRKPKPGMLKSAAREFKLSLKDSYFIGDTIRDVFTAKNAGCKSILVFSGKEKLKNMENWEITPDLVFKDLLEASKFLAAKH